MHDDLRIPYKRGDFPSLDFGGIELDGKLLKDAPVNLVLKSFNRHGLIAGATGSGKTKSIQVLCEQLSLAGIPSMVMDIKGDISGLAMPGIANDFLRQRNKSLNLDYTPRAFPVEFLTLNQTAIGLPMRATINDFGAILFSRMLDLNDTQSGVVTIIFEYAKEKKLPLIDLADFKALLQFVQSDAGKPDVEARFGAVAGSSVSTILRKIIELEAQGANSFFAEPAFQVTDLVRTTNSGQGIISILRLLDMQDKPKLFSTFMLKLLADVYRNFPELGDPDKPKLVLFIDEAHLIFNEASKALLSMLETIVKLIRSKGVGLIFCTQTPDDIPDAILGQLGLKIQHALRAFTAKDRQAIRLVAKNFPPSKDYDIEQLLTSLGIGEALVCALDEKGQPTPLIECLVRAPESRMGVVSDTELAAIVNQSTLYPRYATRINSRSAAEVLKDSSASMPPVEKGSSARGKTEKPDISMVEKISKNTLFRQITRQILRQFIDQIMKILGIKKGR